MNESIRKPFLERIYYTLILFFYIYAPPIVGLPYNPAKFMFLLVLAEVMYKNLFHFKKFIIPHIVLYIILLTYTYSILLFHGTFGIFMHTGPVRQILTQLFEMIPFSILFSNILINRKYTVDDFINIIISIFTIQGFIILLEFVSYDFRLFFQKLIGTTKIKRVGSFQWFRGIAFSLTKNYDFALAQSFGLFIILAKFFRSQIKWFEYVTISLILLSIIVSGRTGFIGVAMVIAIIVSKIITFQIFLTSIRKFILAAGIVYLGYFSLQFIFPSLYSSVNNNLLPWAFEFYYNYMETGELTTESSDQLHDSHYYDLPDKTLFHGDGKYTRPDGFYYGLTDAGYMRQALYFGIFGIILFSIVYIRIAILNNKYLEQNLRFIIPSIVLLLFIGHYKGDVFTNSLILNRMVYIFGFGFLLFQSKKNEEEMLTSADSPN
ncbi:MAG: hypothetical protein ACPG6V_09245 [Flavobacteriales bacterium]